MQTFSFSQLVSARTSSVCLPIWTNLDQAEVKGHNLSEISFVGRFCVFVLLVLLQFQIQKLPKEQRSSAGDSD